MNAILPTRQTTQPARAGLAHHEILADGLIHVAAVYGFEPDERFVERVAMLAWANGAVLVQENIPQAADVARRLSESLETVRGDTERLCGELAPVVQVAPEAFAAVRSHYETRLGARSLNPANPDHARPIRQLVGEAALGGLLSRGIAPDLHRAILDAVRTCRNESLFLAKRLLWWGDNNGLPVRHPLMDLTITFYRGHPLERDLVCGTMGRHLESILDREDPLAPDHWLQPAWKDGIDQARMAPDTIAPLLEEYPEAERISIKRMFRECVAGTLTAEGKVDLVAAYERYLAVWKPYGFNDPETRQENPRMVAVQAFDFALWMGLVSQLPEVLETTRGAA